MKYKEKCRKIDSEQQIWTKEWKPYQIPAMCRYKVWASTAKYKFNIWETFYVR